MSHRITALEGALEHANTRSADLGLVSARCGWVEDQLREHAALLREGVSGTSSPNTSAALSSSHSAGQAAPSSAVGGCFVDANPKSSLQMRNTCSKVRRNQEVSERAAQWQSCVREELEDAALAVASLRGSATSKTTAMAADAEVSAAKSTPSTATAAPKEERPAWRPAFSAS